MGMLDDFKTRVAIIDATMLNNIQWFLFFLAVVFGLLTIYFWSGVCIFLSGVCIFLMLSVDNYRQDKEMALLKERIDILEAEEGK